MRERLSGRRDDDQLVRPRRERPQGQVVRRPARQHQIDLPMAEPVPDVDVVADVELDADVLLLLAETLEQLRHEVLGGGRHRG